MNYGIGGGVDAHRDSFHSEDDENIHEKSSQQVWATVYGVKLSLLYWRLFSRKSSQASPGLSGVLAYSPGSSP